ncbi:MAG: hypothetical protein A2X31_09800 [Elusimicrobia bacterium GWB2_63_22]|nr:MAG: hypothetical protein A2X31_09800 [Elusimicrobia bacterium GWB2_63_22]HCC49319.1 hypothetical protein [Elusimicrobiota bacterium]
MKKTISLLALACCFAAADAGAQTYQLMEMIVVGAPLTKGNAFQRLVRPYRDRTERFSSARLDALQMSIAVGDPADELTLEGWGDNRADLRKGASRVKAEYGKLSGDGYTGNTNDEDYPGDRLGAYGRFGSFEAELSRFGQDEKTVASGASETYNETGAGAGLAFGAENVRLGLHGNFNKREYTDNDQEYANNAAGGALAVSAGIFELGATADYVDRGTRNATFEETRSGPLLGAQALIKPFGGLRAALRASVAKLSGELEGGGNTYDFEGNNNELGARAEWAFEAFPLTIAASAEKLFMDPGYSGPGISASAEVNNISKALGAVLRPFGGRLLLGAEIKDVVMEYDQHLNGALASASEIKANTATAGAEVWLLPGLALRASFQRLELDTSGNMGNSETLYNVMGGGVGLKGEHYTLDASVRRLEEDPDDGGMGDRLMEIRLMYGYRF